MERQSNMHSPRVDEQLKHEVSGVTGAGRSTHAEEWKDPEPSGEDQPDVDRAPDGTLTGGVPEGMTAEDVEQRSEMAAALGKEVWPATGAELVAKAQERSAPDRVLALLGRLEQDRTYTNAQDAWTALGGGAETHRF